MREIVLYHSYEHIPMHLFFFQKVKTLYKHFLRTEFSIAQKCATD